MLKKIRKNSKSILSLVLAFSMLTTAIFTGIAQTANAQTKTTDVTPVVLEGYDNVTIKDFNGLTAGTFTSGYNMYQATNHTDFDNVLLSMKVTFGGGTYTTRLDVAGAGWWSGIKVYPSNAAGDELWVVSSALDSNENYGMTDEKQSFAIDTASAGVDKFVGEEFILQLAFDFGEVNVETNKADLTLGVYINGNLCKSHMFTGCNMAKFKNYLTFYCSSGDSITYDSVILDNEDEETGVWDGSYSQPTTTDTDGNTILITTPEELAWVILQAGATSAGVTYKVADGITAFYMNENTADLTLEQVKNNLNGNNKNTWECQGKAFQGTLDGNGVTIYGLYTPGTTNDTKGNYGALVPTAEGSVTVKNLAVKNSCIGGYLYGSALIGCVAYNKLTALTVEKCVVTNNYIHQTGTATSSSPGNYSVGVIGGCIYAGTVPCSVTIDNCLIYGNELYSAMSGNISTTIARFEPASGNAKEGRIKFSNLIISGAAPWCGNYSYYGRYATNFSNVYTDTDASGFVKNSNTMTSTNLTDDTVKADAWCTLKTGQVAVLNTADMQGEAAKTNMATFAWDLLWQVADGEFPVALFIKENAGSSGGITIPDGAWDGEVATAYAGGDGTKANPFIIENIAQLYLMVKSGGEDASGNSAYFKVKDGIYDIYANPVEGKTSSEIKAYFKDTTTYKTYWNPQTTKFNGNFDGNGVTIHGLYNIAAAPNTGIAFLPKISNSTAVIQNVEFADCYFENTATEYSYWTNAAVVVGASTNSTLTMKNIAVCNSTVICDKASAAVFVGVNGSATTINTTFTMGNVLESSHHPDNFAYCYEGILYGDYNAYGTPLPCYKVKNAVFTEADEYITRIHYSISATFENTYAAGIAESNITGIKIPILSQDSMQDVAAKTNMPELDWSAWVLTDSYPIIAALHKLTYTQNGDNGHSVICDDCTLDITLEAHSYDDNYQCILCGFEHTHTLVDNGMDYDATCVDSGIMNVKCEYCDYISTREICAKTHNFSEVVEATAGDCQTEATVAYKTCSQCELCFASTADINSTEPLDHIGTGYTARHNWIQVQDSGVDCIEYYECSVCHTYLVEGVMMNTPPQPKIEPYYYEDISTFRKDTGYTAPTLKGYVFAGWYEDAAYTLSIGSDVKSGSAWAKFVDEAVLSVKPQVKIDTETLEVTQDSTSLRFVTTVDSLHYRKISFYLQKKQEDGSYGKEIDVADYSQEDAKMVYEKLYYIGSTSKIMEYEPTVFSEQSKYFKAFTLNNIPNTDYDTLIKATPFWITLDGTVVRGEPLETCVDYYGGN